MEETKYQPVLQCIYCGNNDTELSDEHIIPYSLGGLLVLPKSSCKSCENITHRFEGVCARQIFGKFRIKHDLPTRRRKERPKTVKIGTLLADGSTKQIKIPFSEHPSELFIFKFHRAFALEGLPPDVESPHWVPIAVCNNDELNAFKKKYQWDGKIQFKASVNEYAKMLAKIGHSYVVAELGLGLFKPIALDLIMGRTSNICYAIGGDWEIKPAVPDGKHLLSVGIEIDPVKKKYFIVAHIRLFSSCGTPDYHVVVGEVETKKNAEILEQKIKAPAQIRAIRSFLK